MRRASIVMLVLIGAVVGALTAAVAYFVPWLPEVASVQRERIDVVFYIATAICVAIFALVAAVIVYSVVKFRARPDDDSDGEPIHGHTGLEIAWTAVPTVLVIVIGVASAIVLGRNERTGDNPLKIEVTGQQFAWSFRYPNGITAGELRLPLGRTVLLRLTGRDVIHSFWVPEFGQKQDAVPGIVTDLVVTPTKLGTYPVICTELCGLGHSAMRSQVTVMPRAEFAAWLRRQGKGGGGGAGGAEAGAAVFARNGCGSCHVFTPAKSEGGTGPSLDELPAEARKAGKPLPAFVRESIVSPGAYVEPGYPANVMPKFELSGGELDALVQYLVEGSKGGSSR